MEKEKIVITDEVEEVEEPKEVSKKKVKKSKQPKAKKPIKLKKPMIIVGAAVISISILIVACLAVGVYVNNKKMEQKSIEQLEEINENVKTRDGVEVIDRAEMEDNEWEN